MSTQKAKFKLFSRLQNMGFTYDEAVSLRRIEMTLQRWAERECGDGSDWAIERAEPRKLAIWHDPDFSDGLRVVALDYNGRFAATIKHLPAHLKQDVNPNVFPDEAIQILAKLQQREYEIEGKPFNVYHGEGKPKRYPVADREKGALRRLKAIVDARNHRESPTDFMQQNAQDFVFAYSQGDCRGCMLSLCTRADLTDKQTGETLPIAQYYTRGLSVCA
jgi:hypothetical protein